jgi:hypothetical protein
MSRFVLLAAATAFALSGCGAGEENESVNAANAMPTSRTENGQLTARVQGVDLKVNLPPPIRRMTEEDDFIYPGARILRDAPSPGRHFTSLDSPATVARWYRDPARASRFTVDEVRRDGASLRLTGRGRDGERLAIAIAPGPGDGTEISILTMRR